MTEAQPTIVSLPTATQEAALLSTNLPNDMNGTEPFNAAESESQLDEELLNAIHAVGIANDDDDDNDDDNNNNNVISSGNNTDWGLEVREGRVREGCCPNCGTRLFRTKRTGLLLRKKVPKALDIPGRVARGQCLQCAGQPGVQSVDVLDGDFDAAIALSAMEDPNQSVPTTTTTTTNNNNNNRRWNDRLDADHGVSVVPATANAVSTMMDATYRGSYNNYGERHGQGELVWSNGDKFKGKFVNGKREGQGTLEFGDGSEYVGDWRNNCMHGQGTRRFADGNVYTGQYRNGERSGPGRLYFSNGDLYNGEWRNDTMTGFGRYHYHNGQAFEGFFWQGQRSGKGKYQLADGRMDVYLYENDKRVGEGVRWSANRKKAWKLVDGKQKGRIKKDQVAAIIAKMAT